MLTGWRVAAPEFASSVEEMLSGEGAFLTGGRWSSKGTRVVYLRSSLVQASMELVVPLGRAEVLRHYHKMEVSLEESLPQHIELEELPADWVVPAMASSVQAVGDSWAAEQSSLILQVPSAAVAGEYNYPLNPRHPDLSKAAVSEIIPFNFDPRLLK